MLELNKIHQGDWIELAKQLDDKSIDVIMTSPPYWGLRDYGVDGQLGLESHPQEWINKMAEGLAILKKKLKKTGSLWLNVGDTYHSGMRGVNAPRDLWNNEERQSNNPPNRNLPNDGKWFQPKQLMLMPSRLAIALQDDGWILRNDCIWHKPNPMPSSVKDRLNTTFEHVFHFVKSRKYYYDLDAIREPHKSGIALSKEEYEESKLGSWHNHELDDTMGQHQGINTPQELHYHPSGKNPGDFWQITTQPFPEAHFATYPVKLCEKPIKATLPKEICVKCGFIRERITKTNLIVNKEYNDSGKVLEVRDAGDNRNVLPRSRTGLEGVNEYQTIGWTSCNCEPKQWRAGIVLDPFAGAGTTFVAMYEYNPTAKFIGFELNQKYIDIAMKRLKPHMEQTRLNEILVK